MKASEKVTALEGLLARIRKNAAEPRAERVPVAPASRQTLLDEEDPFEEPIPLVTKAHSSGPRLSAQFSSSKRTTFPSDPALLDDEPTVVRRPPEQALEILRAAETQPHLPTPAPPSLVLDADEDDDEMEVSDDELEVQVADETTSQGGNAELASSERALAARLEAEARAAREKTESDRLAEAKRVVREKADAARRETEARAAREKAEGKRLEEERIAREKAEAERVAEEERIAREKAEAERVAEEERIAREKAEATRLEEEARAAHEKAEAERVAEEERIAREKAEATRLEEEARAAHEKAEAERIAEEERAAREKAEAARLEEEARAAQEKAEAERVAEEERAAREKAEAERVAREKASPTDDEAPISTRQPKEERSDDLVLDLEDEHEGEDEDEPPPESGEVASQRKPTIGHEEAALSSPAALLAWEDEHPPIEPGSVRDESRAEEAPRALRSVPPMEASRVEPAVEVRLIIGPPPAAAPLPPSLGPVAPIPIEVRPDVAARSVAGSAEGAAQFLGAVREYSPDSFGDLLDASLSLGT